MPMSSDNTIPYIERSKKYYEAQGFHKPYAWSHSTETPFTRLKKPLPESKVTIVTTTMPDDSYVDEQRRLAVGDLKNPPEKFFTDGLFWDRDATHTDDRETYFPINELNRRVAAGELGDLAEHYYCVPTIYSHRRTAARDAPKIVQSCLKDKVDVALLVPL